MGNHQSSCASARRVRVLEQFSYFLTGNLNRLLVSTILHHLATIHNAADDYSISSLIKIEDIRRKLRLTPNNPYLVIDALCFLTC